MLMARSVPEWIGKSDDAMPGKLVRKRLRDRNGNCCWQCGSAFGPGNVAHCDHITPLIDEGENRESNLQMLCPKCHGAKTSAEAKARKKSRDIQERHFEARRPSRLSGPGFRKSEGQHNATRRVTEKFPGDILARPFEAKRSQQ